ncbi:MAG: hypothetical protein JXA71_03285 [Chitinispirillaceae bacterium]|nr:hypothetical protein [Chitinispirillaceae bacterium]
MKKSLLVITIAGVSLGFTLTNAAVAGRIRKRYRGWIAGGHRPVVRFDCVVTKSPRSGGRRVMPRIRSATFDSGRITRDDFDCRWSGSEGAITMRPSMYTFDACLRVLLCTLLQFRNGVLLHASAVIARGKRGFVFAGRSGSGKTTIARMLGGGRVINDEICAVTVSGARRVSVSGTPFWGEMRTGPARPQRFRLSAIYFLKKSAQTVRQRLDEQETVRRLLVCICHFSKLPGHAEAVLDLSLRIARHAPAYELRFRRNPTEVASVALRGDDYHGS